MASERTSDPHQLQQQMTRDTEWAKNQFTTLRTMKRRAESMGYVLGEYKDMAKEYPSNKWLVDRKWFKPHFKLNALDFTPPCEVDECIQNVEHQLATEEKERRTAGLFNKGQAPKFDLGQYTKLNEKVKEHQRMLDEEKGQSGQLDLMNKLPVDLYLSELSINTTQMSTVGAWQKVEAAVDTLERLVDTFQKTAYEVAGKMDQSNEFKPIGDFKGLESDLFNQYVHAQDKIRFDPQMRLSGVKFHPDVIIMNKLLEFASRELTIPQMTEEGEPTDRLQMGIDFLKKRTDVFTRVLMKKDNSKMQSVRKLYESIHRVEKLSIRHIMVTDAKCLAETLNGLWSHPHVTEIEVMYYNLVYKTSLE